MIQASALARCVGRTLAHRLAVLPHVLMRISHACALQGSYKEGQYWSTDNPSHFIRLVKGTSQVTQLARLWHVA